MSLTGVHIVQGFTSLCVWIFQCFAFYIFFYGISTKKKSLPSDLSSTGCHRIAQGKQDENLPTTRPQNKGVSWRAGTHAVNAMGHVLVELCLLSFSYMWPQVRLPKAHGLWMLAAQGLQTPHGLPARRQARPGAWPLHGLRVGLWFPPQSAPSAQGSPHWDTLGQCLYFVGAADS